MTHGCQLANLQKFKDHIIKTTALDNFFDPKSDESHQCEIYNMSKYWEREQIIAVVICYH